jgi:hypothetical protein
MIAVQMRPFLCRSSVRSMKPPFWEILIARRAPHFSQPFSLHSVECFADRGSALIRANQLQCRRDLDVRIRKVRNALSKPNQ